MMKKFAGMFMLDDLLHDYEVDPLPHLYLLCTLLFIFLYPLAAENLPYIIRQTNFVFQYLPSTIKVALFPKGLVPERRKERERKH